LDGLPAFGRSGRTIYPLDSSLLIPLPEGSRLYFLPGRMPLLDGAGRAGGSTGRRKPAGRSRRDTGAADSAVPGNLSAVAAFLPPGYVALSLAAFERKPDAPVLPLYCYCAVCWYRGEFQVPAIRVDHDPKHDPGRFDREEVARAVRRRIKRHPGNRLLAHHGLACALRYGCPNAANLFLRRWEAPVAVSGGCNAACQGCISKQDSGPVGSPQERIDFVPTIDEIVEIAVPHLEQAPRAMISFGQGCEGEPLLQGKLVEDAIREIRRRTNRGTVHVNTNGSMPRVIERLVDAGLDSIRISLNSARDALYSEYYRCRGYTFDEVMESFRIARKGRLWTSVNYLTFPGVTDDEREYTAFAELLADAKPSMIQWRNLNIDPDWYMETVDRALQSARSDFMGIPELMRRLRAGFPRIRMGYFNPA
jgi:pyruvate-formate lyase-activating enzyme